MSEKTIKNAMRQRFAWGHTETSSSKVQAIISDIRHKKNSVRELMAKLNKRLLRLSSD